MGFFQRFGIWADRFCVAFARLLVLLSVVAWRTLSWLSRHGWAVTKYVSASVVRGLTLFVKYVDRQPAFSKLNNGHWVSATTIAVSSLICFAYLAFNAQPVFSRLNLSAIQTIPVAAPGGFKLASFDPNENSFGPIVGSIPLWPSDEPGYNFPDEPGYNYHDDLESRGLTALPLFPDLSPPVIKPKMKHDQFIVRPRRRPRKGAQSMHSSVSGTCLPRSIKNRIAGIENRFGRIRVISTYRRGARIAGTGRISRHASCRAIDFYPPRGQYRAVLTWLRANHRGGLGTYSCGMRHIHIDNGRAYRWHHCVSKRGVPRHRRYARKRSSSEIISE